MKDANKRKEELLKRIKSKSLKEIHEELVECGLETVDDMAETHHYHGVGLEGFEAYQELGCLYNPFIQGLWVTTNYRTARFHGKYVFRIPNIVFDKHKFELYNNEEDVFYGDKINIKDCVLVQDFDNAPELEIDRQIQEEFEDYLAQHDKIIGEPESFNPNSST